MWILLASFIACDPVPSRPLLVGEREVVVHHVGPVEAAPRVTGGAAGMWQSDPPGLVEFQGDQVIALAPGTARLTWSDATTELHWTLRIAPDATLRWHAPPTQLTVGTPTPLQVHALIGGEQLDHPAVNWTAHPPRVLRVDGAGIATGQSPGMGWVTASWGTTRATIELQAIASGLELTHAAE